VGRLAALIVENGLFGPSIGPSDVRLARPFAFQLRNRQTLPAFLNWGLPEKTIAHDGDHLLCKSKEEIELPVDLADSAAPPSTASIAGAGQEEVGLRIYTLHSEEGRRRFQDAGILPADDPKK